MRQMLRVEESRLLMGTVVSIEVVGKGSESQHHEGINHAFEAIRFVEEACSRFDDSSALRELCRHPGEWVQVPDVLFEALRIALEVSELTDGAFDPTIGATLARHGFTRHYLTGDVAESTETDSTVTYRDISLDQTTRKVLLHKPMLLDLGAIAKGLAIDVAAGALQGWEGYAINAGGDIYLQGIDPTGNPWTVGIQHPLIRDEQIAWLQATDLAICTSGSYERRSPLDHTVHHILYPLGMPSGTPMVSCTVIAPLAVLADAVSTAAFLLGSDKALEFVDEAELAGLCIDEQLSISMTQSMRRYLL